LSQAQGKTEVILGDGRISLEKELLEKGSRQFDVLAIDAFSGDVIPTHLLTSEAIDLYMKHLNKEGILAFHISNKFLNLMPVMNGLSGYLKMPVYLFHQNDSSIGLEGADWVLFTNNQAFLSNPAVVRNMTQMEPQTVSPVLWTDDFAPVLPLFKWK
jgi:spermidine synthase